MLRMLRRAAHERSGYELYCAVVAAARAPYFYLQLGVPDTLDGRFDMVGLYGVLLIRRLRALPKPGDALAQAVFDAMFHDMDINLRELGVSDLSVGKRVREMWEAFHGRANAYGAPLTDHDAPALAAALARNVWRLPAESPVPDAALRLATVTLAQAAHLDTQDVAALRAGRVGFLPPESVPA